jgi:hypothetical protein
MESMNYEINLLQRVFLFLFSVDATEEPHPSRFGRLVNHGRKDKNCVMKAIEYNGLPSLCLFALRDILPEEELLYDYGVKDLPWEVNYLKNISLIV